MLTVRSIINIASQTVPPIIPVVQGDTGRAILFTLADFTIPAGATATYYVQKPSGEAVYNNATIDGNNVLVNLTAQSIIEKGDNYGQVRIAVGEDIVTSFDFILLVKEFRGIDAVQSLTEMNIFDKAVEQAADAIDEVKTDALDDMDSAKTTALDDIGDAKEAALQEIEQTTGNFADDFSASATYAAGDYVIHSGQLYRFTASHASGAWTGSDAEAVTVGEELTDLKAESTELKEDLDDTVIDRMTVVQPVNRLNLDAITPNKVLLQDGSTYSYDAYYYTDFIEANEGDVVYQRYNGYLSLNRRSIACYDSSKNILSGKGSDSTTTDPFTVPSGVSFVRITLETSNKNNAVVTVNQTVNSYIAYEPPYYKITEDFLTEETKAKIEKNNTDNYACSLPNQSLKMTVGIPEKWYKINMATPPTDFVNVGAGSDYITKENDGFTFPNNTVVSSGVWFKWQHYNEALKLVSDQGGDTQYGRGRYIVNENLDDCTLLVIGDSTVDHDKMTETMLNYFSSKGKTLTLLGTLGDGSSDNHNEGRAGWKATDYLTNKQYNGVVNPFYNPASQTFDFSYYMTNQGYSAPDFVVIQLGINDLYYDYASAIETTWDAIKTIIDSIIAYNSSIKILMNLPTPPNADDSKLYNVGFLYRNAIVRYAQYAMDKMDKVYGGETKIRPTYCHLILDASTDIRDDVHPTNDGYAKMGMEVINQINCWQN